MPQQKYRVNTMPQQKRRDNTMPQLLLTVKTMPQQKRRVQTMVGCLVDSLVDWLRGWLVAWLVGCSVFVYMTWRAFRKSSTATSKRAGHLLNECIQERYVVCTEPVNALWQHFSAIFNVPISNVLIPSAQGTGSPWAGTGRRQYQQTLNLYTYVYIYIYVHTNF